MPHERKTIQDIHDTTKLPSPGTPPTPVFIDGVEQDFKRKPIPDESTAQRLAQILRDQGIKSDTNPGGMVDFDFERRMRSLRDFRKANPKAPPQQLAQQVANPRTFVVRTPLLTGNRDIDFPGEEVKDLSQGFLPKVEVRNRPQFAPESEKGRKAAAAKRGIDFRTGAPFAARLSQAATIPVPSAKAEALLTAMSDLAKTLPPGLPLLEFDADLGEWIYHRQITDSDVAAGREAEGTAGQFRRTVIDAEGLEVADIADMFNLAEIGSIIGAVASAGKGRIAFWSQTGRTGAGGLAGREVGNLVGLMLHELRGGEPIPASELRSLFTSDVMFEAAASFLGEAGVRIVGKVSDKVGTALARLTDRVPTTQAVKEVAEENIERATAREALDVVQRQSDNKVMFTEGELSGNNQLLVQESEARASASARAKQNENLKQVENKQALKDFNDKRIGSDALPGMEGRALDDVKAAVFDGSKITIAVDEAGKRMRFFINGNPNVGAIVDDVGGVWKIKSVDDFGDLRDIGVGTEMYQAMALEARRAGKVLHSDELVTEEALKIWKNIDGQEGIGQITFNKNVVLDEGRIVSTDGLPVAQMEELPTLAKNIIEQARDTAKVSADPLIQRTQTEPLVSGFERFRVGAGGGELGLVARELQDNPYLKQEFMEKLFESYERDVISPAFSSEAHGLWMKESKRVLNKILGPEEFNKLVQAPGSFRELLGTLATRNAANAKPLARTLGFTGEDTLGFLQNNGKILEQLTNLSKNSPKSFKRAMAFLSQNPEHLRTMQNLVRDNLRDRFNNILSSEVTLKQLTSLESLLGRGENTFLDLMFRGSAEGTEYLVNVKSLFRLVRAEGARNTVRGAAREQHPTTIMFMRAIMFKDVFGRRQRFFSAAQKARNQSPRKHALEIITDPSQLKDLMRFQLSPVGSRQAMQMLSRLGILEEFGVTDINDPEAGETVRRIAAGLFQEMVANADEQTSK